MRELLTFLGRKGRQRCYRCGAVKKWAQVERPGVFGRLARSMWSAARFVCLEDFKCRDRAERKQQRQARHLAHVTRMRRLKEARRAA